MRKCINAAAGLFIAAALIPAPAFSMAKDHHFGHEKSRPSLFEHVGTFDVMAGNGSSVAEIVDVTMNGNELVYTDSPGEAIGFVDITDPAHPVGLGTVDVGGEPTSLVVLDPLVLVGVNTSGGDYANPSGQLVVVNKKTMQIVATHELGGQPDSLALAPDHKRAAIVIENERNEDLDDGLLPQYPTGTLLIVNLKGAAKNWQITEADLTPVAAAAPNGDDLEVEFVDINSENEAVVSFQENNYLAIVDMVTGETINHFSAGVVALKNVDTVENDLIEFDSDIEKRAEPDSVAWIDDDHFATANEGDYEDENGEEGGGRGFTIFSQDGTVQYESGESFEHWLASAGHYNENRSENKGCEPESVEFGQFGHGRDGMPLLFVGSERCNAVGVYDISDGDVKEMQLLPTGIGPEGLKAIPRRNLFVASTETDVADAGIPTMITIYQAKMNKKSRKPSQPFYPMIESERDENGVPIPWVALSGLSADPDDSDTLYGVSDSFLAEGFIYTIDVSAKPAKITGRMQVTGASADLDLEAIAVGPDNNFWLGSEGDGGSRPNLLLKVNATDGQVITEIELPVDLADNARKNGFEGVAVTGAKGQELVYVAIQRAWPKTGDSDGVNTKIGRYDVAAGEWTFVYYPLEAETEGGWIGLSELSLLPNGTFAVIERDKGWGPTTGPNASLKAIYGIDLASAEFRSLENSEGLVTVEKTLLHDVLSDLEKNSIWTAEKLEGLAVAADDDVYIVTDNDGLDDATGETVFLKLGRWQ